MWDTIREYVNSAGEDASVTGFFAEHDPFSTIDPFSQMPTEVYLSIIRELEMDSTPFAYGIDPRFLMSAAYDVTEQYDWTVTGVQTNSAYSAVISPMGSYARNRGAITGHTGLGGVFESRVQSAWEKMRDGGVTYSDVLNVSRVAIVMVIAQVINYVKGGH